MKANFDKLHSIMERINGVEDDLQSLRDQVDTPIKAPINESIRGVQALRDLLWAVDKALENESEDARNAENLLKDLDKGDRQQD